MIPLECTKNKILKKKKRKKKNVLGLTGERKNKACLLNL